VRFVVAWGSVPVPKQQPRAVHCSTFHAESKQSAGRDSQFKTIGCSQQTHYSPLPRARTPVRYCGPGLMRDEVRKKVGQNPEQSQTGDAVGCKNPRSPALVSTKGRVRRRGLFRVSSGNDRGPIFHARTSDGKIVAQLLYASRLPRIMAKQDYLSRILLRIGGSERKNVTRITVFLCK
jgi:hypothetical protein